jgi:hypothetical protein
MALKGLVVRSETGVVASCVVLSFAALAAGAPATAKLRPITGRLSQPGYDVIALATDGKATTVRARTGRFRLRPPAAAVTLQLRAPNGGYAGPIVVGRKGKRAVVGVKAGARLGRVTVHRGYAKVSKRLRKRWIDARRTARARRGVPIGVRVFGRVRSRPPRARVRGDRDLDGIPDPLDIDDDGDLVLDNLDGSRAGGPVRRARAAQAAGGEATNPYCQPIASGLQSAAFFQSANVNAFTLRGLRADQIRDKIDEDLMASEGLRFSPIDASSCNPLTTDPVELDCGGAPDPNNPDSWIGGLSYCTRGGSGQTFEDQGSLAFPGPAFGQLDPDGDGKGTLPRPSFLRPRAKSAEIKTGQPLSQVVTNGDGTETSYPGALNFVFVTTPALASYRDSAGNCAKVSGTAGMCATEFSYPMAADAPGNVNNGFPVAGGPCPPGPPPSCVDGDVVLTLTFWRPQREPVPKDPPGAAWMDIFGLTYSVGVGGSTGGGCAQQDFSSSDLTASTLSGRVGLTDSEGDQPSSPANTFTYNVDLSKCYLAGHGRPFASRDEVPTAFGAVSGATDAAGQTVFFRHR